MATIEFEVWCEWCTDSLNTTETKDGIDVEPCEKCLKAAKEEGYNERLNEED